MLNLLPYVFLSGRGFKLLKSGVSIINSTNPIILTKNITLTVINCCAPPPLILTAHCAGALASIAACTTVPNPVTIGTALHLINF